MNVPVATTPRSEPGKSWAPHVGPQQRFLACRADEALFGGAAGGGKLLALDTPIPTPSGWTPMGGLRRGDVVFNEAGEPCCVVVAHDVVSETDAFDVVFDDGSTVVADAAHRWLTFDAAELAALTRRDDAWRAMRRSRRPSRARANDLRSRTTAEKNRRSPTPSTPAPTGTIRTTATIAETLRTVSGRTNHAVPVAGPLVLGEVSLPLDPYLFGAWLGDGTTRAGSVTTADREISDAFAEVFARGAVSTTGHGAAATHAFLGLRTLLRKMGVFGAKHIPIAYLRASVSQRRALLEGLMDTDGHACASGAVEFTTTSPVLARDVLELIVSLGWKAAAKEGRATLRGRDVGPKWRIKWTPSEHVFRLERKRARQKLAERRTTRFRYVVRCERRASVPMRCITVSSASGLFLAGRTMVPTHNSDCLLLGALRYVHEPTFRALLLRRTYPELEQSLMDRSWRYYPALGGHFAGSPQPRWKFPSGARITFASIEHEKSVERFRSDEYQYIAFDELTTFTERQYVYLLSRLRSSRGLPCRMRAGTNPGGPGHEWVKRRFAPWLYAAGEHSDEYNGPRALPGEILSFVRDEASDEERVVPHGTPDSLSRTFFPATYRDNPSLNTNDPQYLSRLAQLDRLTRRQLREGDWHARAAPGEFFDRAWFEIVDAAPIQALARVRWWDRAATEENPGTDPDWTVGLLLSKAHGGLVYVEDVERFREPPAEVEKRIKACAERDREEYGSVRVCLAKDPGSAGKFEADHYVTHTLAGFDVHMIAETGDKVTRAKPVSAQAEHGNVKLVRAPWNRAFLDELESFPEGHDDQVDGFSGAYSQVANASAQVAQTGGKRELARAQGGF